MNKLAAVARWRSEHLQQREGTEWREEADLLKELAEAIESLEDELFERTCWDEFRQLVATPLNGSTRPT